MKYVGIVLLYAGLAVAAPPASQPNDDWPKWRGPNGDGICRAAHLATTWPESGPRKLWADAKTGKGFASPIAADGRVYLFSVIDRNDTLTAYDAATGRVVWRESYGNSFLVTHGGTRATPTIAGGRIYTFGGAGDLVCRELATGRPLWQTNVLTEAGTKNLTWGTASSPLVLGERVYVQVGVDGPTAVAADCTTGRIAWRSASLDKAGYAPIVPIDVAGRRHLVVFAGRSILALDPADGKTIWRQPWATENEVNAATPVYRGGQLFLSSGYNHGCVMLQVAGDGAKVQWQLRQPDCKFPSPILDGDYLYAIGERTGTLTCLHWPDGRMLWVNKDRRLQLGFGGSMVRLGGDRMIALSDSGQLFLLAVSPDGAKIVSRAQPIPEAEAKDVWSTPLVYQGKLYVKGGPAFVCLDISGGE